MKTVDFLNQRVMDLIGRGKNGDVYGVELELEGRGVMMDGVAAKGWKRTHDGSLRGESVEYVFSDPCKIDTAKERINTLFKKFKENGVDIKNSYRTSTHVHLNFGDKTVKQLLTFFVLFTMLEEILETYSGEERAGNLFCLSSRRSEHIIEVLADAVLKHRDFRAFANDQYKYAACNLSTLYKFGSAEIRTMRGANTAEQVNSWLDILDQLFKRAMKAKSPIEFIENISILGPDGFMRDVFEPRARLELVRGLPAAFDFRRSLMDGARLCQVFAYDIGDDFNVEPPVREFNPGGNQFMRPGPINTDVIVYNNRGNRWHCRPSHGGPMFFHGDRCIDDHGIIYDEDVGRFHKNGSYLWYREHPFFGDEMPVILRNGYGWACPVGNEPPLPAEFEHGEPDFDEDDDDF